MTAMVMWVLLALRATPQAAPRGVAVAGVVQDQAGAILPGAQITLLVGGLSAPSQSVVSDLAGAFRFDRVPPGLYDIRSEFPGFNTHVAHVRVTTRAPASTMVVMTIEGFRQEVSVGGAGTETSTNPGANLNAITLDEDTLDNLPVLDQDIVGAVSRFLDSRVPARSTSICAGRVSSSCRCRAHASARRRLAWTRSTWGTTSTTTTRSGI